MSTIKVNKIENTATADGGIAIDATGHVTVDGQQLPTAGALSNRNLIINGAMTVSQRSTSETGVNGSGYKTLDRIRYSANSLAATEITHEQSTDAPDGFANSLKVTVTTAEGSVGAADGFRPIDYRIEGQDLQHLQYGTSGAKSLTLSFYVKSSVTGTYGVCFYRDESTDRQITDTYTISSANTWEYKTITIPGDTSASITNDNASRFNIYFHAGAGSDSTSTDSSGSWVNYTFAGFAYGNAVNLQNTLNATWQVTGIQLEVGSKATPFEHRSYGDELARCQRYFYKIGGDSVDTALGIGAVYSSTQINVHLDLPCAMRTKPSAATTGASNWLYVAQGSSSQVSSSSAAIGDNGDVNLTTLRLFIESLSSLTAGNAVWCLVNSNHSLDFSAEL